MGLVEEANYIEFADTGDGMSLADLNTAFLTIGTRNRLQERDEQRRALARDNVWPSRPVLGEKGVGRLAAMRLGRRLHVRTTTAGEACWNLLDIDWGRFSHDSDKLLEEVPVEPRRGPQKDDRAVCGTTIRIAALSAEWSSKKLEEIARKEFSKLTDPFVARGVYPIFFAVQRRPGGHSSPQRRDLRTGACHGGGAVRGSTMGRGYQQRLTTDAMEGARPSLRTVHIFSLLRV